MMKDPRVRGLATEFTGNWLAFRLFETNNAVDRERFPQFNNDLREAMFQEPIRYVEDTIQNNRPVFDLLYGDYTFVNPVLAKHYGIRPRRNPPHVRLHDPELPRTPNQPGEAWKLGGAKGPGHPRATAAACRTRAPERRVQDRSPHPPDAG